MERRWALVVPGHSRRGRISGRCRALLEHAALLVEERTPRAIVFSGSTSAQNVACTLPLLLDRGVQEATVVCMPLHRARVG